MMEENNNKDELVKLVMVNGTNSPTVILNEPCLSNEPEMVMHLYETSSTHWKADGIADSSVNKKRLHDMIYSNKLKLWICKHNKCRLRTTDRNYYGLLCPATMSELKY